MKLSDQITAVLGSDDWLVLQNGHHLFTADELDERATNPDRTGVNYERQKDAEIRIENALAALTPGVRADPDRIIRILTGQE